MNWIELGFMDRIMNFNLVLLWKHGFFTKMAKRYELCEILEFIGIDLWNEYLYATALKFELCIYSVEAFELVHLDFGEIIGKC